MGIISLKYALLVLASVIIYYVLIPKYRTGLLVLVSCGFIASFSIPGLIDVSVFALSNFLIAKYIPRSKYKIALFRTGIILNLGHLILLKYSSFAIDPLFQFVDSSIRLSKLSEIVIPIGISYFTLQGIGYLVNVKMGWEKPEKDFFSFFLYIVFFPKFISGPIERSNRFMPQLKDSKTFNKEQFESGLRIVLTGVFKKVAIANQLAPYAINSMTNTTYSEGYTMWVIFLLQPLYLYFDFSGYTDIGIGVAKMFGIDLMPNFNRPFFSENMTTFWKRFHISLSSWFNDYIFKQISFKYRKWGVYASLYALAITWLLFGIWHGAGWTFMLIGVLQVIAITFEFFTKGWRIKLFSRIPTSYNNWISRGLTYLFYCLCMVFFFSPDVRTAVTFLGKLTRFGNASNPFDDISIKPFSVLVFIPVLFLIELLQNDYSQVFKRLEAFYLHNSRTRKIMRWMLYSVMMTIIYIIGLKSHQFVYANF